MTDRNEDGRFKKELGVARASRAAEDRPATEDRDVTDEDRLDMFRNQMFNNALHDLPAIPGYHVCWLTTTNPRDTITRRMQLGYEPVRPDEVPGLELSTIKTGEYVGMIGVNEMVAFKLPERLYQAFMQEAHYDGPNREEERLNNAADQLREQAARAGVPLIEDEGYQELRQAPPAPTRFE
jgi:hypothetical protein